MTSNPLLCYELRDKAATVQLGGYATTMMRAADEIARLTAVLVKIANNTDCDVGKESAVIAREALAGAAVETTPAPRYQFRTLGHLGQMYGEDGEEVNFRSGTWFNLAMHHDAL